MYADIIISAWSAFARYAFQEPRSLILLRSCTTYECRQINETGFGRTWQSVVSIQEFTGSQGTGLPYYETAGAATYQLPTQLVTKSCLCRYTRTWLVKTLTPFARRWRTSLLRVDKTDRMGGAELVAALKAM